MRGWATVVSVLSALVACGGTPGARYDTSWLEGARRAEVGPDPLRVRWILRMVPEFDGKYIPVETAVAGLDPERMRVYVGSTHGKLLALSADGKEIYRYEAGSSLESRPALDLTTDELYLGTEDGRIHALAASDGTRRWVASAAGPLRQAPLLSRDALYTVTDSDVVSAIARKNGDVLWRYKHEMNKEFTISGHAGLTLVEDKLITGMSDGKVVALDVADGRVHWMVDTGLDAESESARPARFLDVDTTPIRAGPLVYVASFTTGLYAIAWRSGAVEWREAELDGVTAMAMAGQRLVLSSSRGGVRCIDRDSRDLLWRHAIGRGAPAPPVVVGDRVYVGESAGGFVALSLRTGREVARVEAGHGFSAAPALYRGRGFILSNGGTLFAFTY